MHVVYFPVTSHIQSSHTCWKANDIQNAPLQTPAAFPRFYFRPSLHPNSLSLSLSSSSLCFSSVDSISALSVVREEKRWSRVWKKEEGTGRGGELVFSFVNKCRKEENLNRNPKLNTIISLKANQKNLTNKQTLPTLDTTMSHIFSHNTCTLTFTHIQTCHQITINSFSQSQYQISPFSFFSLIYTFVELVFPLNLPKAYRWEAQQKQHSAYPWWLSLVITPDMVPNSKPLSAHWVFKLYYHWMKDTCLFKENVLGLQIV